MTTDLKSTYRFCPASLAPRGSFQKDAQAAAGCLKDLESSTCSSMPGGALALGTRLASPDALEVTTMFAVSAILIGVLGIFYVRRRSARKKNA
jgi:hypothetical protein